MRENAVKRTRSLTRNYKKAETTAYKIAAARVSVLGSRLSRAFSRIAKGASRGLTIMILDDSTRPPRGITLSYFRLGLGAAALAALLALTAFFLAKAGDEDPRVASADAALAAARSELDELRDEAGRLSEAFSSLRPVLSQVEALGARASGAAAKPALASMASLARGAKRSGDLAKLSEARTELEAAIPPLVELGSATASMEGIKRSVPALWPLKGSIGHLSATYGPNPNPFTGQPYFHKGIDCSNYREGDSIVATADGVVVFAGVQGGYGRSVVISHANGYFTRYAHMQRIVARAGQPVKQGQTIGIVGNTGNSTGPHTHYEVIVGNGLVDPIDFLWSQADRKAPEGTVPFGFD